MGQASSKFRRASKADGSEVQLFWYCPGCEQLHAVQINGPKAWTWNGDLDCPTFAPSILVSYRWGEAQIEQRCHTFIRDGLIEFLGDCSHGLAGKTVPLPDLPDRWRDSPPTG